ncbi:MAG: hypothetical protein ACLVK4_01950 [Alistipes shahii]|uniref:hypothetical protein n=1 Tax=Alistipes shahii TaxID=328814 RepID=UPI00399D28AF
MELYTEAYAREYPDGPERAAAAPLCGRRRGGLLAGLGLTRIGHGLIAENEQARQPAFA